MKLEGRKEAIPKRQLNYSRLSTKLAPRSLRGAARTVSPTKNLYERQR